MIPESHKIRQLMVYCVTNIVNGKIYIGKTRQTIRRRWNHHMHQANMGCSRNLCKAIRKYGEAAFKINILGIYETLEDLNQAEIKFIADLRAIEPTVGYNMTPGGEGDIFINNPYVDNIKVKLKGRVCSEETKEKIRKANKGRKFGPRPPEWGESIRKGKAAKVAAGYVYKRNPNIPGNNTGKKASPETRAKLSAALKRQNRPKPIWMYPKVTKKVDTTELERLAKTNLTTIEISQLLGMCSATVDLKMKEAFGVTVHQFRVNNQIQLKQNKNFLPIDKYVLDRHIRSGMTNKEIAECLGVDYHTVNRHSKLHWGASVQKLRDALGIKSYVHLGRSTIVIPKESLEKCIRSTMTIQEISEQFQVSSKTLNKRVLDHWGVSIKQLRLQWDISES